MRTFRGAWSVAGLVAGAAGLATSYFASHAFTVRDSPIGAVAKLVIDFTPGWLSHYVIEQVGNWDKPLLLFCIFVLLAAVFAWAGRLARRSWWASALLFTALGGVGVVAVSHLRGQGPVDFLMIAIGYVTWLVALPLLTEPLRRSVRETAQVAASDDPPVEDHSRRAFLLRTALVAAGSTVLGTTAGIVGRGRRRAEEARRLLRLPQVTEPVVPPAARVGVKGVTPWQTKNANFYRIDTDPLVVPTIDPKEWTLRIHGMVEREITLTYEQLIKRKFTEGWITLACVSNYVGGDLIGNAWFSGVRIADLLAEARPLPGADAVLQTADDGWTCGTPLSALTDGRKALLAVAMNGEPLPLEHGFPVRTVVPGLYGYVSACKWVVDFEVTRFSEIEAYWTKRGWAEEAPIKLSSRVDVPRAEAEVPAGAVTFGGVAWAQHTGIQGVQYAVDGGEWRTAEIAAVETDDTWIQWRGDADLAAGSHTVKVRAVDKSGRVQTGVETGVLPDGATGWHTVPFSCV